MNQAHFHLVVNHLPIIFPIVGAMVLIGGFIFRSEIVKRTAYFIFIVGAVSAMAAMVSGEGAEEIAENLPGVTDGIIHEHEESAELFAIISYLFGALSLIGLWANWKNKAFAPILSYVLLIGSFVVIFLGRQTGTTGGEVRHTEIRSGQGTGNQGEQQNLEFEEDED